MKGVSRESIFIPKGGNDMIKIDSEELFLSGPHGALPLKEYDEITFKLAMLF